MDPPKNLSAIVCAIAIFSPVCCAQDESISNGFVSQEVRTIRPTDGVRQLQVIANWHGQQAELARAEWNRTHSQPGRHANGTRPSEKRERFESQYNGQKDVCRLRIDDETPVRATIFDGTELVIGEPIEVGLGPVSLSGNAALAGAYYPVPMVAKSDLRLIPPPNFSAEVPDDTSFKIGLVKIERVFKKGEKNDIICRTRAVIGAGRPLSATDLPKFRKRLAELRQQGIFFHYEPTKNLNADNYVSTFRDLRALSAKDPENIFHRGAIASLMKVSALGEEARRLASKMVLNSPDSIYPLLVSYEAHTSNCLGELHGQGMDYEMAFKSIRQAASFGQEFSRLHLARHLEYHPNGGRYDTGETGKLNRSQEIYELLPLRILPSARRDLGAVSLVREDGEALAKYCKQFPNDVQLSTSLVALTIAQSGMQAGLERLDALTKDGKKEWRDVCVVLVASKLRQLRKYSLWRDFLNQHGAPVEGAPKFFADRQLSDLDVSDPRSALERLLIQVSQHGVNSEEVRDCYVGFDERDFVHEPQQLSPVILNAHKSTASISMKSASQFVGVYDLTANGNDEKGYVVLATPKGEFAGYPVIRRFVSKTDDGYKIYARGKLSYRIGYRAIRLLDQGKAESVPYWVSNAYVLDKRGNKAEPFSGTPFSKFLFATKKDDTEQLRTAAYMLAVRGGSMEYYDELIAARPKYGKALQLQIDRQLCPLLSRNGRIRELRVVANRLFESAPENYEVLNWMAFVEIADGDFEKAAQYIKRMKTPEQRARFETQLIAKRDGHEQAMEYCIRSFEENPHGTSAVRLGWYAFLSNQSNKAKKMLAAYADSVAANKQLVAPEVHFMMACIFADCGDVVKARISLILSIESRGHIRDPIDNMVLGLIAEKFELPNVARKYYERVKKTHREPVLKASFSDLAEYRLSVLDAGQKKP